MVSNMDLVEFMRLLSETPRIWELIPPWESGADPMLRTQRGTADKNARQCPITAVAKHHFGMIYPNLDAVGAAAAIGLLSNDAQMVIRAADGRGGVEPVRSMLLESCSPTDRLE